MGTWGTAIFSDDFASDIKSEFRDKIGFGKTPSEATNELINEYKDVLDDQEEYCVFWIALAATQWKLGRLQDNVKNKALEIIDSKKDLDRWSEDSKDLCKREIVLQKLREELLTEQPKPKKIPTPFIRQTKMEIGDLLLFKHKSDKYTILRVTDIKQDHCGDRYPKVEILDYYSKIQPDKKDVKGLKRKSKELNLPENSSLAMMKPSGLYYISSYGKRDIEPWDNLSYLDKKTESNFDNKGTTSLIWWKDFEEFIEELFKK